MAKRSERRNFKRQAKSTTQLESVRENITAVAQGPQLRKSFNVKDIVPVYPKTDHQEDVFHLWNDNSLTAMALLGAAGTGKSYMSMYLALRDVLDPDTPYEKVVIVRSTVSVRSSGFLPGTLEEKLAPLEDPYSGICDELFPWKKSYENLKKLGKVEFCSTEFLRGKSFNDAIVIVDEVQNMSFQELMTIATRVGVDTRIILCGDTRQNDLIIKRNDVSGLCDFIKVLDNMDEVGIVEFDTSDIVRSGFVRSLLTQAHLLGF